MQITRRSPITGIVTTMEIAVTEEELSEWKAGTPIQKATNGLTSDEREFIVTGLLPAEWDELMKEDDDE